MKKSTPLLSIICLLLSLQTFAQTKILIGGELTLLDEEVQVGNLSLEIEQQLEVDWSVFFGVKTYSMILPMDYSYSGDTYPKIRQLGFTTGFTYYLLPHLGLQVNADIRRFSGIDEGVQGLGSVIWTPEKPAKPFNGDLGLMVITRWIIIPLPQFMKVGIGARYLGLLDHDPVIMSNTSTSNRIETNTSGWAFSVNLHFIINVASRKKL